MYVIKKWEEKIERKDLKYEGSKYKHDFQQYKTIRSLGENVYAGKISIQEAEMDQTNLLENMVKFNNKPRLKTKEGEEEKLNFFGSAHAL